MGRNQLDQAKAEASDAVRSVDTLTQIIKLLDGLEEAEQERVYLTVGAYFGIESSVNERIAAALEEVAAGGIHPR